jgi:uncharacterized repeat protein (TIGR03803 family)
MQNALLLAAVVILSCMYVAAQQYQVLYDLPSDSEPLGGLVFDSAGNLYGTTGGGGVSGCFGGSVPCGTVFELSPGSGGTWTFTTIYEFCASDRNCPDGAFPLAGLAIDSLGNLYGTTQYGGMSTCEVGCGVVFELSPPSARGGTWTYTNLHTFCSITDCADGANPRFGALTLDKIGNLYGTAENGGKGAGVVFELSPLGGGWTETVLYNFCSDVGLNNQCLDGNTPQSSVTFDQAGNLYGTTMWGGLYSYKNGLGSGVVFKLSLGTNGWTQAVVYAFPGSGSKGSNPIAPVGLDPSGNLYTTASGYYAEGVSGVGKISRGGQAHEIRLDDTAPSGVLIDTKRNVLYGYTFSSVYEINASGKITSLPDGGSVAYGTLIEDESGNLYGVSSQGGRFGGGVVYEITP